MDSSEADYNRLLDALEVTLSELHHLRLTPDRLTLIPDADSMCGGTADVHCARLTITDDCLDSTSPLLGLGGKGLVVAVKQLRPTGTKLQRLRIAIIQVPLFLADVLRLGLSDIRWCACQRLARELALWARLDHPNILGLLGFCLDESMSSAWLISAFQSHGNISQYLQKARPSLMVRQKLAIDTARGLKYLHGLKPPVCHGDIKAANVLVTDDFQAVLMDFGLSKALEGTPSGLTTTSFGLRGSTRYMSPELVSEDDARRTLASDVWAWGCLLLEILTDRLPYADIITDAKIILSLARLLLAPARPNDMFPAPIDGLPIPDDLRSLLKNCWKISPEARPTMIQCLTGLSLRSRETWANAPVSSISAANASREVLASFMELDLSLVAPELTELGRDWFAIHNEDASTKMDISSVFIVEHPSPVLCVRFSNDGHLLAALSGRSAHIYDCDTGECVTTLVDESTHKFLYVRAAAFSPDSKLLATGSEDRKVRVWDIHKRKVIHVFHGHVHKINAVAFSANGSFLLSGASDKTLWVWDLESGGHYAIYIGHRVKSIAILAEDRFVAVTAEQEIQLWDIAEGRLAYRVPAHNFEVVSLAIAKGGEVLISGGVEDEVKAWDVRTLPGVGMCVEQPEREWSEHWGYPSPPPDVARSPTTSEDDQAGTSVLPDCLATLSTERRDQRFNVVSVAASKDGAWIVSGTQNRGVWIWNPRTGLPQLMLGCHYRYVMSLDVGPTADASQGIFASGGEDGTLKVWRYAVNCVPHSPNASCGA